MTKEWTWSLTEAGSWGGACCFWPTTPQCLWPLWGEACSGWWRRWGGRACLHATQCQRLTPSTDTCTGGRGKAWQVEAERSVRAPTWRHSDFTWHSNFVTVFYWQTGVTGYEECIWGLIEVWNILAFYFFKLLKHSSLLHTVVLYLYLLLFSTLSLLSSGKSSSIKCWKLHFRLFGSQSLLLPFIPHSCWYMTVNANGVTWYVNNDGDILWSCNVNALKQGWDASLYWTLHEESIIRSMAKWLLFFYTSVRVDYTEYFVLLSFFWTNTDHFVFDSDMNEWMNTYWFDQ